MWGVLATVTFVIKTVLDSIGCYARFVNISTEFQLNRNADVLYQVPVKCVVARENSANLVCRQKTLHNTSLLHSNC